MRHHDRGDAGLARAVIPLPTLIGIALILSGVLVINLCSTTVAH
jgi:hypothetical protein